MNDIAYIISYFANQALTELVSSGHHPQRDYLAFTQAYPAVLLSYDDIEAKYPKTAGALKRSDLLPWAYSGVVFDRVRPFAAVIAASEVVGLPLAVHAYQHYQAVPINIIVHGVLYKEQRLLGSIRNLDPVKFLCISETLREMMVSGLCVPSSKVINIAYGVDTSFFSPRPQFQGPPLILSAGLANRDFNTLVKAVQKVGVRTVIAAASEWCSCDLDIAGTVLPENVQCGAFDYCGLRDLYWRASCIVVPLYPAPFACGYNLIAEAMAMGKPVITTRTDCYSDLMIDRETGLYVRPGNVNELAEALDFILRNPDVAAEMGKRGRARVEEHFSLAAYCDRIRRALLCSPPPLD